jgi:tetraacyldisaccharide 4'-kinase
MADLEIYFKELVEGKRTGVADRLLLAFLTALSFFYALIMRLRSAAYASGIFPVRRLARPVISVGNITAGGTGKTPTVALLARYFMARGKRVVVLSRGYGGTLAGKIRIVSDGKTLLATAAEAGDEPYLLAASIPGLMVMVGADRYRAGRLAEERLNPDIFILDDGFQHLRLHRDLNILLLDSRKPFNNGNTFPAGLLRESKSALERADLVIFTRCTDGNQLQFAQAVQKPFCLAVHALTGIVPIPDGPVEPFTALAGKSAMAFAGIADPASFFDALEGEGVQLVTTLAFADHVRYAEEQIAALCRLKDASCSACLITTEKDAVKLAPYLDRLGPVYAAVLEVRFLDKGVLEGCLEKLL